MMKYLLLFICFATARVSAQVVNNVRLVDHQTYYTRLMNEVMHEVERREWCNLKLPDIPQTLDVSIYGWHLNGSVTYKNGFLHSLQSMDLVQSTVQQVWTHDTTAGTSTVALMGTLRFHELALAFDVEVALEGEPLQHFTGIYMHELVQFSTTLRKIAQTGELSAVAFINSLSATNTRRMMYMPESNLTQVLQRQYRPSDAFDGINDWASRTFAPIMLDLATNVIQYPTICYNCPVV